MANRFIVRLGTSSTMAQQGGSGSIAIGDTVDTSSSAKKILLGNTYKTTSSTIVNNARNVEGKVVISVVRDGVRKIELSWRVMSASEYAVLATFFNTNFSFYAWYFDCDTNDWLVKEFYVSDRTANAVGNKQININASTSSYKGGLEVQYYENVKISLIEV